MFEQVSVMRDDQTCPIKTLEHIFDHFFGVEIQMVRRLIHDDDMGPSEEHLGERDLGPLTS